MSNSGGYYVPSPTYLPFVSTVALFVLFAGAAMTFNLGTEGSPVLIAGLILVAISLVWWFGVVIGESENGLYDKQVDVSFRMGMAWFIFSEVMFFAAFFGALYYARIYSVPWIGGEASGAATHEFLWPDFTATWPLLEPPSTYGFSKFKETIGAWGIPFWNTAILLTSGATVTWAHWGLIKNNRRQLIYGLSSTVALGLVFVFFQAEEYIHAYRDLGLTLNSGIYGATFFLLTGFHGFHVSMGTLMLAVILARSLKGHFTPKNHFAFEAVAWYWHFVDVVWIGLFIFVYWL